MRKIFVILLVLLVGGISQAQEIIATNLNNPRGIAMLPDGRLVVMEAGLGDDEPAEDPGNGSGRLSIFEDVNDDGDYDDEGERTPLVTGMPSYNSLTAFFSHHDEVFGMGDVVVLDDGRIFFTKDDPFFEPGNRGDEGFYGDVGVFLTTESEPDPLEIVHRVATLNAITYDPQREVFYVTESGFNRIMTMSIDGEVPEDYVYIPPLAHGQQAVPSGLAVDPLTGDVLVALFSGYLHDYGEDSLSFMPLDAKIIRINPDTGEITDAVTNLTTAIDVAVDENGNIYTVELTTTWATALMPIDFDLHSPDSPPDAGGYARYTGRISMYPANGSDPIILADGIDTPTNISYLDGRLYVSAGLGTPGRQVISPHGVSPIEGVIYVLNIP